MAIESIASNKRRKTESEKRKVRQRKTVKNGERSSKSIPYFTFMFFKLSFRGEYTKKK